MAIWVARTYDRQNEHGVLDNMELVSCVAVFVSYLYNGVKYSANDSPCYVLSLAALVDVYTSVPPFARVAAICQLCSDRFDTLWQAIGIVDRTWLGELRFSLSGC